MSIDRWDPGYDHYPDELVPDGDWVRYSDHDNIARAWRDLVRRAWSLLDIECPNHPLVDELQAALAITANDEPIQYRITPAGREHLDGKA